MKYAEINYKNGLIPSTLAQNMLDATKQYSLIHVRDVPFEGALLHTFYDEVTCSLGECLELGETPGSVAVEGRWTSVCYDPTIENAYRSSANAQPLHTDASYQRESPDATCMYCIRNASQGGETVFISGEELIELLKKDSPILLDQLCTVPVCFSRRFENASNEKTRRIIDQDDAGKITLTWNYYRVDEASSVEVKQMCEAFHQYLQTREMGSNGLLALHLKPGEAVLWLDEALLHGRNGFIASQFGDRHLVKTCLKLKGNA